MSGPKVVRIITREEILAVCNAELARVDAALGAWIRSGTRNDCVSADEIAAAQNRRSELAALIAADRFMDFQKVAEREIAFLASDLQVRLAKAAEAKAAERARARRQAEAACALLSALRAKGAPIDDELASRLQAAANGRGDPAALAQGFAQLSPEGDGGAETRKSLAALHRTDAKGPSLADWMTRQPLPADEARLQKVDRRLAELEAGGGANPVLVAAREAVGNEPDERRRALLLDSLELDMAGTAAAAKARAALENELDLALAALSALSPQTHAALSERRQAKGDADGLAPLLTDVKAAIETAKRGIAARARREAVLQALQGLGYEVDEGMATAWANEGQVVLRSASRPDYGVEIVGQGETDRLQMRAVAFEDGDAATADPSRDRDAETIWCSEVGALQAQLSRAGSDLDIIKARGIGEVPLKRVRGASAGGRRRERRAKPKARTMD